MASSASSAFAIGDMLWLGFAPGAGAGAGTGFARGSAGAPLV